MAAAYGIRIFPSEGQFHIPPPPIPRLLGYVLTLKAFRSRGVSNIYPAVQIFFVLGTVCSYLLVFWSEMVADNVLSGYKVFNEDTKRSEKGNIYLSSVNMSGFQVPTSKHPWLRRLRRGLVRELHDRKERRKKWRAKTLMHRTKNVQGSAHEKYLVVDRFSALKSFQIHY